MSRSLRHLLLLSAIALATLTVPGVALADALVVVTVDSPSHAEGVVTLTSRADAHTYSCTMHQGSCSVDGVPGGRYSVVFTPTTGQPTDARGVMIAPAGRVELHLAAP